MDVLGVGTPVVESVSTLDVDSPVDVTSVPGMLRFFPVRVFHNGSFVRGVNAYSFCNIHIDTEVSILSIRERLRHGDYRVETNLALTVSEVTGLRSGFQ